MATLNHIYPFKQLLLVVILLNSCSGGAVDKRLNDTAEILKIAFTFKKIDAIIPRNADRVFVLKNKYWNKSWPPHLSKFNINYIDDSPKNRKSNHLSTSNLDTRIRIGVPVLKAYSDSARVVLYNFNFGNELDYRLKKLNDKWVIIKVVTRNE